MNMSHNFGQAARMARPITTRGGGVILTARTPEGLSLEEIAAKAPSIFAEHAHESRSARYVYTDTRTVLGGLMREGFTVQEVRQGGSRIAGKAAFTKHAIRLSAPESRGEVVTRHGGAARAQVVLRNAHDGTSSYQLRSGVYRFLCLNGMVCGDDFEDFRVGHVRGAEDKIIDAAFRVVEQFPQAIDSIREMDGLELRPAEQAVFAEAALQLRWEPRELEGGGVQRPPIEAETLNRVRRMGDEGNTLWMTMNRVQEGLIRGGQRYRHVSGEGRDRRVQNRTVGAVNSIDDDSKINRALWTLAAGMQRLKAAA
jgi:hypothetical protein